MRIDALVEQYVKVRDHIAVLDEAHKAKVAPFKEVMDKIEQTLLAYFNETGQDSARTPAGTAYRQRATSATVGDRPQFLEYVRENNLWELVDARAAKKNIEEYIDEHGSAPPGINFSASYKVNFRRS